MIPACASWARDFAGPACVPLVLRLSGTCSWPHSWPLLCRSYLTPVRDEEAESLRKARSRQARQTRRSTQVSVAFSVSFLLEGQLGSSELSARPAQGGMRLRVPTLLPARLQVPTESLRCTRVPRGDSLAAPPGAWLLCPRHVVRNGSPHKRAPGAPHSTVPASRGHRGRRRTEVALAAQEGRHCRDGCHGAGTQGGQCRGSGSGVASPGAPPWGQTGGRTHRAGALLTQRLTLSVCCLKRPGFESCPWGLRLFLLGSPLLPHGHRGPSPTCGIFPGCDPDRPAGSGKDLQPVTGRATRAGAARGHRRAGGARRGAWGRRSGCRGERTCPGGRPRGDRGMSGHAAGDSVVLW